MANLAGFIICRHPILDFILSSRGKDISVSELCDYSTAGSEDLRLVKSYLIIQDLGWSFSTSTHATGDIECVLGYPHLQAFAIIVFLACADGRGIDWYVHSIAWLKLILERCTQQPATPSCTSTSLNPSIPPASQSLVGFPVLARGKARKAAKPSGQRAV
jgi:hypothetical protein